MTVYHAAPPGHGESAWGPLAWGKHSSTGEQLGKGPAHGDCRPGFRTDTPSLPQLSTALAPGNARRQGGTQGLQKEVTNIMRLHQTCSVPFRARAEPGAQCRREGQCRCAPGRLCGQPRRAARLGGHAGCGGSAAVPCPSFLRVSPWLQTPATSGHDMTQSGSEGKIQHWGFLRAQHPRLSFYNRSNSSVLPQPPVEQLLPPSPSPF